MATIGEVTAILKANVRDFKSGMDQASRSVSDLEGKSKGLSDRVSGLESVMRAAAGAGVALFARAAITSAVNAEEAASAFATSFGPAAEGAGRFVEEFANKAGMANYQLEQMMAVTGSVVQGLGASEEESAALSQRMVTLAADVASFSNAQGGAAAVMLALQSAINGEREALKTYGLALSEAEVQQQAFNMTGKTTASELTRMDKALATVELAYGKASKAVGDLDRTQDSHANSLRRAAARVEEMKVSLGESLLPVLDAVLPAFESLVVSLGSLTGVLGQIPPLVPAVIGALGGLMIAGPVGAAIGAGALALAALSGELEAFGRRWSAAYSHSAQGVAEFGAAFEAAEQKEARAVTALQRVEERLGGVRIKSDLAERAIDALTSQYGGNALAIARMNVEMGIATREQEALIVLTDQLRVELDLMDRPLAGVSDNWEEVSRIFRLEGIRISRALDRVNEDADVFAQHQETAVRTVGDAFGLLPGLILEHKGDVQKAMATIVDTLEAEHRFQANLNRLTTAGFTELVKVLEASPDRQAAILGAQGFVNDLGEAFDLEYEIRIQQDLALAVLNPLNAVWSARWNAAVAGWAAIGRANATAYGGALIPLIQGMGISTVPTGSYRSPGTWIPTVGMRPPAGGSGGGNITVNVGQAVGDELSVGRLMSTAMRKARIRGSLIWP